MNPHDIRHGVDIKGYDFLENLALNLCSSWKHSADELWRRLDPELWELTHNPWAVLQTVSREKLTVLLADQKFSGLIDDLVKEEQNALGLPTWFQENHPQSSLTCTAYFSMEFMLSEALPIYSGGLGNVAGDQLKAASDLGVPVVGIGLLYSQGYFRQLIDQNGDQQEFYPYNDPGQLPIRPLRLPNGEWLRLKIELPGWSLWLRTWEVQVGRRKLYLLDSNDIANVPSHREITNELYGGDRELRLKQELVLGIGGWRLLEALGIQPEVCHMNEGHAAFAVLERALSFMQKTGEPFEVALTATRKGNLFTTHTAVSAGFDRFSPDLITKYLGNYAQMKLGISIERLLSLGQINPKEDFNMAYLAIRGSGFVNGVSQLHGSVSRRLFESLFPRWTENEIPVGFVTNGVHMPSWDSPASDALWTEACGKRRWLGKTEELEQKIHAVPDTEIWDMRNQSRSRLIDHTRNRLARQLGARGALKGDIEKSKSFLNPDTLTLGFARRFAAYKRPDLLLSDEERFLNILTNKERPVQLIIAGKAHPADKEGHALIKKWMTFLSRPEARNRVVFLGDYDMILTEHLVEGVDLWINTPQRPWEACGTSGMKVLVNGGLNLSELDGWWAEAYTPEVGWALGDGKEHDGDPSWNKTEANTLYDLLEKEVIPEFYTRDQRNIPTAWMAKIQESMALLTPRFSSNRAVREYTEKYYFPAAEGYRKRSENNGALAKQIVDWETALERSWGKLGFGELKINTDKEQHLFEVQVYLDDLDQHTVKVELYSPFLTKEMENCGKISTTQNGYIYRAAVSSKYPASGLTPRIIPRFSGVSIPLELSQIRWQK
ncbi:MAG: alpha-glucan family phosphorylase [Parachlamydiaceae bacterium]